MFVKTKMNDELLKFYLPLRKPKLSTSGKNLVIASTMGPAGTGVEYEGQPVLVVANAFVKNNTQATADLKVSRKAGSRKKTLETE